MRISVAEMAFAPNRESSEARKTMELSTRHQKAGNRLMIPRSDEDDPVRVKFFEELARKRAAKQAAQ